MAFQLYEPFMRRFRPRRLRLFYKLLGIGAHTRVLDVGGGSFFWDLAKAQGLPLPQITVLNIRPPREEAREYFTWVIGDARRIEFPDRSFDAVFSNSLIEHLGDRRSQFDFACEVRRLAPSYFVQTPDRRFPIEPHFVTPLIHWLPRSVRSKLIRNFTLWGILHRPSSEVCRELSQEIALLNVRDMADLFPDAQVISERFAGFPKSILAFKSAANPQLHAPLHSPRHSFLASTLGPAAESPWVKSKA